MGEVKQYTSYVAKEWGDTVSAIISKAHPNIKKKKIDRTIMKLASKTFIDSPAELRNNYTHQSLHISLDSLYTWIRAEKPIIAGFGVLFKNQEMEINPAAEMLQEFLRLRGHYKKVRDKYDVNDYLYMKYENDQMNEKVNANSYYGCSGARSSVFYNIYTAAAVTATGQMLISTTEQSFEAFVSARGYRLQSMDECYRFLFNIVTEDHTINADFLNNVNVEMVIERLRSMFYDSTLMNRQNLYAYLMNCTQEELNRIYYKNNLYEFIKVPMIHEMLKNTLESVDEFRDPNKVPKNIEKRLDKLTNYVLEFVGYFYSPSDRVKRLKRDTRAAVVGVDTDSNMVGVSKWVYHVLENIVPESDILQNMEKKELEFAIVNVIAYMLTLKIERLLLDHTKRSNLLEEYRPMIAMKNEFLFWRAIYSNAKKRYITLNGLREGFEYDPPKLDVKGMDFMKATTRERTKNEMLNIIKDEIVQLGHDISIPSVFRRLENLETEILDSLSSGNKEFLIPSSVKEIEAYKDPIKSQGVKAVLIWNMAMPDETIELPAKVDLVKVKIPKEEDLELIREKHPDIYVNLKRKAFHGQFEKFRKDGIEVIAVPSNYETVPEWIQLYTDYDRIANDNMSRFTSVMNSLEIKTVVKTKRTYFTNIISI